MVIGRLIGLLVALGLLASCGSTSSEPSVDVATETAGDTTNQTGPSPDCDYPFTTATPLLVSISVSSPSPKQIEDAGLGKFQWGTTPEVVLSPPIDWNQDPFDVRSWRYGLHSMNATLYRILLDYQSNGNLDSLELGAEVALDWIKQNPQDADGISEFAWYDSAVGIRLSLFSYLLAESERIASLEPEPLATLRCSVVEQAEWLFDDENYKFRHNHGLFQDAGLYVAARNAGGHERSTAWIDKAESRFIENLTGTVDVASGIHLEHSPAYHAWITNIASGLSDNVGLAQDELVPLIARMQEAGGWLVQPDGNYPQFGDTDRRGAPGWMQESAGTAEGLGWFDTAGVGVVREDGSYLAFASWYHSSVHKHSDELSFVWFDAGNRIIVDSGRYGYYYDEPGRIYAESNPAHNTVHFGDPFRSRDVDPYGSGMIDATQTDGWYAMLGENRAIATDDFRHRRTLVFKPGRFVATIDYGLGANCEAAVGHLHFAPEWEPMGAELELQHSQTGQRLMISTSWDNAHFVRGQETPVQGFTFPENREWEPSTALIQESDQPCHSPLVTVVHLSGTPPVEASTTSATTVEIHSGGQRATIDLKGDQVELTVAPG